MPAGAAVRRGRRRKRRDVIAEPELKRKAAGALAAMSFGDGSNR
jgi:hypothetical protein